MTADPVGHLVRSAGPWQPAPVTDPGTELEVKQSRHQPPTRETAP
ncbi:hypothetical protein FHX34_101839 [Actinoplanes teichomyceticus]|uniref:Uncharacterized protein n=1 Tax=Actinoplanes teichomyceticus TaxID=1867 RepID=A0A561WPS4_ACTTI|nr:hypothetical protein FHX34_101839 [Actinoplanes teichomyceticus]